MRHLLFILLITLSSFQLKAQATQCVLKEPAFTIHFGSGNVNEVSTGTTYNYSRVRHSCPSDGHYSYTSFTSDCFRGDWHTLTGDHTGGNSGGNMMIVNASWEGGSFLTTTVNGLKGSTIYEFSVWMMNVCRPTDKCPFPLLPNISILLQTSTGKTVARISIGELPRREAPHWTQYRAQFTTPSSQTPLTMVMINDAPGGCGNDFALDDISFRECVKTVVTTPRRPAVARQQPKTPAVIKSLPKTPASVKPPVKKDAIVERPLQSSKIGRTQTDSSSRIIPVQREKAVRFPPPPTVLVTRSNPVIKKIEAEPGEVMVRLYDNGEIDGDTVSIYHNNRLVVSRARLSITPVSYHITVDEEHPHHELIMVAENLGSIPPNTSLMVVTSGTKRYEVFISSSEQKNGKIVIDLK